MGFFDDVYKGTPPWEIGRPQSAFVGLAEAGLIAGSVLDVGCGTGDNALYLASKGYDVWGVDIVPAAVEKAGAKALERGLKVNFIAGNALDLRRLGRTFDTVIDSGLFHTLSDEERPAFADSLSSVLVPGGRYFMLCFSERETREGGPRRVTEREIREAFREGWVVEEIRESHFDSRSIDDGARAWLAFIKKA